jgi:phosphoribosyl 1,2-cyclic phosphate phosphodiesterase
VKFRDLRGYFLYDYHMKLTVLGSGTSHGIPVIGCSCPVCCSSDSKDKRTRCSLYVEGAEGERAIIDTGPEFRLQALAAGITALDAVFLTHAHADHVHGLDDIRPLSREKPIPIYGNKLTIKEFRERFSYIFKETQIGGGKPRIDVIEVTEPVRLGRLTFTPIPVKHGKLDVYGWIISEKTANAIYLTDCSYIDEAAYKRISQYNPLTAAIIGGLRNRHHETHFSFEEALNAGSQMGAGQIYLTHICHNHSNQEIEDFCRDFAQKSGFPGKMGPAWDGMSLELV